MIKTRMGFLPVLFLGILLVGTLFIPPVALAKKISMPGTGATVAEARTTGRLEIRVFNVGKGDAILLTLPNGRFAMIDTGYEQTAPRVIAELKALGVRKLDLLVLTHHDKDHVGGYPHLLEAFEIDRVVQSYDQRDKKKTVLAKPGTKLIDANGVTMTVLAPRTSFKDENDASLVTKLTFGNISVLFTGDIIGEAQPALLAQGDDLKADLLKVPHHGRYSGFSPRALFRAVAPKFAIITCDEKNGDPPEGSVLRMLGEMNVTVLRSDRDGTIRFVSDGKTIQLEK